ncbi:MAG: BlaI family transcriptional regulator [Gemmatimonadota bacterium]
MTQDPLAGLSAREREMFDIVVRLGEATAAQVGAEMDRPPTNATVRSTLRILERKGWLAHRRDGARFVYHPTQADEGLRRNAIRHLVDTFFGGSVAEAMSALLDQRSRTLGERERQRLDEIVRQMEEGEEER